LHSKHGKQLVTALPLCTQAKVVGAVEVPLFVKDDDMSPAGLLKQVRVNKMAEEIRSRHVMLWWGTTWRCVAQLCMCRGMTLPLPPFCARPSTLAWAAGDWAV